MPTFGEIAAPWIRLGCNVLPILPGAKTPAVAGWGAPREGVEPIIRDAFGVGLALHSVGSPKIPDEVYAAWFGEFETCNACVLPASMDACVVDVDDVHALRHVIAICGPTLYAVSTGRDGGGVHLWYRGATKSRNAIAPGVDVKSAGGYVIASGSLHATSGLLYHPSDALAYALAHGVIDLPVPLAGWRERLGEITHENANPTRLDLEVLVGELRTNHRTRPLAKVFSAIAEGRPFAPHGEREQAIYFSARVLAERWPAADAEAIAQLYAPSLDHMAAEAEALHLPEPPGRECVLEKWSRLVHDRARTATAKRDAETVLRRTAWAWVGETDVDAGQTADPEAGPIVVHAGRTYFVRVGDGWAGPWTRDDLTPDVLASVCSVYGVAAPDVGGLLKVHGARASAICHSLAAQRTTFDDATGRLTYACAPLRRSLYPERSAAVERVLAELGGPWANELALWCAGLLQTERPCRALLLSGKKGRGKSLFLDGLGRLWEHGAAKMRDVLGKRFNSRIGEAGLAIADDDTSRAEAGEALTMFLREAVNDRSQRVERKHHDVATIEGCMRYAIGTNDAFDMLKGAVSYDLNTDSLEAFGDRILHVPIPDDAIGYWERCGATPAELVQGDQIARHVLWMAEAMRGAIARGWEPPDRFWVGEADTDLRRYAVISSGLRGEILIHISECLRAGVVGEGSRWIEAKGDAVLVKPAEMFRAWVGGVPRGASLRVVGMALKALADVSTCAQPPRGPVVVRALDRSLIDWYAEKAGL